MTTQEKKEKASSELDQVLVQLTPDQIRFVVARQEHTTDKAAAESLGILPYQVSRWKANGAPINEAVQLMAWDGLSAALYIRKHALAKAMSVKAAGLDSENEMARQKAATEIIEWEMGKASQHTEVRGTGEKGEIVFRYVDNLGPDAI